MMLTEVSVLAPASRFGLFNKTRVRAPFITVFWSGTEFFGTA